MILVPRFDPKFLIGTWGTPVQELQIGGTRPSPKPVRLFTT